MNHKLFMKEALSLAKLASKQNEVPVGSVVVLENEIIGKGYNQNIASNDTTAHAEIIELKQAGKKPIIIGWLILFFIQLLSLV